MKILIALSSSPSALKEIPGLKKLFVKAVVMNFLLFIGLSALLNGLVFFFAILPLIEHLRHSLDGWVGTLSEIVMWLVYLAIGAALSIAALRASFGLLSLWYENMAIAVARHFRTTPASKPLTAASLAKSITATIFSTILNIGITLGLILIGFIPFIGIAIVLAIEAHMLGRDIMSAYSASLTPQESDMVLSNSALRWSKLQLGSIPAACAFIPVIGWLLLPLLAALSVVGFAYSMEVTRRQALASATEQSVS